MFTSILEAIREYDRIIIHRHGRPDGDAMGSQLGMKHVILENFPGKQVYMVGDKPGFFGFMEGAEIDEIDDSMYAGALAIILDCGSTSMISDNRYPLAEKLSGWITIFSAKKLRTLRWWTQALKAAAV